MTLPGVSVTILDGALGLVPASIAQASVKLGISSDGTPNVLYSQSNNSTAKSNLGSGQLVEAVCDTLSVAGGPVYAVPVTPSVQGTVGSVTYVGGGSATVTPSRAPAKTIEAKIVTGGALATMTVQFRLNGGAWSAPVTSTATSFVYRVPGTLTTLTFADQTYTANDVWTVSTLGAVTVVGSGTAGWVTHASSPVDAYSVKLTVTTGGALGAGVFTYSVDGGNNTSAPTLIPSGGVFAIPDTGVVLTFSGTFVVDGVYTFTTVSAGYGTSDASAALTALLADPAEWGFFHIVGMGTNAAAAASMAAIVDTITTTAQAAFRYVFGIVECPTNGSGGSTESDSTVATAFASFVSARTMVCAGDVDHISQVSGKVIRRNVGIAVASKLAAIEPSDNPLEIKVGGAGRMANVKALYRDEAASEYLDAQRFTTARSHVGMPGYFVTRGRMMAAGGSDYTYVMNRRVMDSVCRYAYAATLPFVGKALRVNADDGTIFEPEALAIEAAIGAAVWTGLKGARNLSTYSGGKPGVIVEVKRDVNILSTSTLEVAVSAVPKGYADIINETIGFKNPAIQTV